MDAALRRSRLRRVKIVHTAVWAFFASCIVAIPYLTSRGQTRAAWWLIGVVTIEVAILAANRFRCPLTDVAARYTTDRQANFDIYLPLSIARYNKHIFGPAFLLGVLYTLLRGLGWL